MYLNCKATAWYRRFLPAHSSFPHRIRVNDTKKARDAEGPEEEDAGDDDVDNAAVSRSILSYDEDENESYGRGKE